MSSQQEQLEAILKEMKVEEYGTVTLKDTIAAITALIQEARQSEAEKIFKLLATHRITIDSELLVVVGDRITELKGANNDKS